MISLYLSLKSLGSILEPLLRDSFTNNLKKIKKLYTQKFWQHFSHIEVSKIFSLAGAASYCVGIIELVFDSNWMDSVWTTNEPRCMTKKVGHEAEYPKVEFLFCLERSICISFRKEKGHKHYSALQKLSWKSSNGNWDFITLWQGTWWFMLLRKTHTRCWIRNSCAVCGWKKPQHENWKA